MLAVDEEAFFVLLLAAVTTVVVFILRHRHHERVARLRMLEEGLRDPRLDAATRQQLIATLTAPSTSLPGTWGAWFRDNLVPRRVFASAAWMAMIVGTLMAVFGGHYDQVPGIITAALGLAVLALPLVLRELDVRGVRR
jgi:hypothetical protein